MSWTSITPFLPFLRLAMTALLGFHLYGTGIRIDRKAREVSLGQAISANRWRAFMSLALFLLWLWLLLGASSAYRPKDAINADYRARDHRLEMIDRLPHASDFKQTAPVTPDWETVRARFREQIRQEREQFEREVAR